MKENIPDGYLVQHHSLCLDSTAITVQLTRGGACASHGNPNETRDLVEWG